jgi:hypothetical protein
MAPLSLRLKAYALIEAMVAMVIIMLCFGIAFFVFNAMTESQRNYLNVKGEIALRTEAQKCKAGNNFFDEDIPSEEFTVQRRIRISEEQEHLATLELKAVTTDGKTIAEYYEFVYIR